MNPKVEEVIEKQKKRLKEKKRELRKKKNFLAKLGLIDKEKNLNSAYEPVKPKVTDEEYAGICKYFSPDSNDFYKYPKSAELLRTMSTIILVLGLISAIVLFYFTATDHHGDFNPISLIYLISVSLTSLITYAFGIAVADIVKNTSK